MFRLSSTLTPALLSASLVPAQYIGSEACRACHSAQFTSQSKTGHAHALAPATKGSPGQWAFGAGAVAITYVSQADEDGYIEHGLSYYASIRSMALTPGHASASDRRYRTFDPVASVLRCFRCHSTGPLTLGPRYSIQPSELGVRCESCHGPGEAHVKAAGSILNPGKLPAGQINEFCGTCHRKPPESGEETDWTNAWNTRHEPDYLSHATCFRKSGGALTCLTCHDPHQPLSQTAASYDKRCVGCHAVVRHRVAVAKQACVGCHMPQVQTGPHLRFTNHWIGVYENGSHLVPKRRIVKGLLPLQLAVPKGVSFSAPADPSSLRPLFEQALADHPKAPRSAADLGLFLKSVGQAAAAEAPLRKALELDLANSDPMLAADQENLASLLVSLGRQAEALELFMQAAGGSDSAVAARSYAGLAALDPARAESYYRSGLEAEERAAGKDHSQVAVFLNNLALALRQRGDNASAEPLLRRALAIQEKALGPDHAAVASTLNNLGSLLQSTGRLAEAERVERRALRIFEQKLGPESMELAITCSNLADLEWSKGDLSAAESFYRRALSIDESVYGPDHPEVAADLANLGLLLKETRKPARANPKPTH